MEVEATRRQKFPEKGQELEQDPSGGQMGKSHPGTWKLNPTELKCT